jgi:signal transduction histidine kinase
VAGGQVHIGVQRNAQGLDLFVADDGAGCDWAGKQPARGGSAGAGVGLGALRRRFELDYGGQARLAVQSAPGAGFRVDIFIPFETQTA